MTALYIPENSNPATVQLALTFPALNPTFPQPFFYYVQAGQSARVDNVFLVNAPNNGIAKEMVGKFVSNRDVVSIAFRPEEHKPRLVGQGFAACLVSHNKSITNLFANDPQRKTVTAFFLDQSRSNQPLVLGKEPLVNCAKRPDGIMVYVANASQLHQ